MADTIRKISDRVTRRILTRVPSPNGDILQLECGHRSYWPTGAGLRMSVDHCLQCYLDEAASRYAARTRQVAADIDREARDGRGNH